MKSKSIFKFRSERESLPPGCGLISTALDRAFPDRHERCPAVLPTRRFGTQFESVSRFECWRILLRIASLREVANAAA